MNERNSEETTDDKKSKTKGLRKAEIVYAFPRRRQKHKILATKTKRANGEDRASKRRRGGGYRGVIVEVAGGHALVDAGAQLLGDGDEPRRDIVEGDDLVPARPASPLTDITNPPAGSLV